MALDFSYIELFTFIMLRFTNHSPSLTQRQGNSLTGPALAFFVAVAAAAAANTAATNTLGFGVGLPGEADEVVVFLATLSLLVIAAWWSVNVLAWTWALRSGITLTRPTLPGSRRVAHILLAASLSTACVADGSNNPSMALIEAGQASTTAPSSIGTIDDGGVAFTVTSTPITTPLPTTEPVATSEVGITTTTPEVFAPGVLPTTSASQEPTAQTGITEHQVIVDEGDNLWSLAAETLTLSSVGEPTCQQISEYWRLVVAVNQVRSGNPDLIVEGETVTMPSFELTL